MGNKTEDISLDLSQLLPKDYSVRNNITGYLGTESIPRCTHFVLWYLLETPLTIS